MTKLSCDYHRRALEHVHAYTIRPQAWCTHIIHNTPYTHITYTFIPYIHIHIYHAFTDHSHIHYSCTHTDTTHTHTHTHFPTLMIKCSEL